MKLDGGLVWRDANAMVTANKEVLAVLAGVFFLLPSLAFSLFMPQPEPPAGADVKQLAAMLREFYMAAAPWFLGMTLIQTVGQLAVLALLARAGQSTVGEALREGFAGLLPFLVTQLIIALASALAAGVLIGLGVTELSVSVPAIPAIKALVRKLSLADCQALAQEVLKMGTASEVRERLSAFVE